MSSTIFQSESTSPRAAWLYGGGLPNEQSSLSVDLGPKDVLAYFKPQRLRSTVGASDWALLLEDALLSLTKASSPLGDYSNYFWDLPITGNDNLSLFEEAVDCALNNIDIPKIIVKGRVKVIDDPSPLLQGSFSDWEIFDPKDSLDDSE